MRKTILTRMVRRRGLMHLIIGALIIGVDIFLLYNSARNRPTIITLLAVFALGVFLALWGLKDLLLPRTHKVYRQLAALGDRNEIEEYLAEADDGGQTIYRAGSVHMTKQFTVCESKGINIFKTASIMWAYKHTTIHRRNGVETHRDYHLMLAVEGHRRIHKVSMTDEQLTACIEALHKVHPSVMLGYSGELFKLFRKQNDAFIAQWKQHKQNESLQRQ